MPKIFVVLFVCLFLFPHFHFPHHVTKGKVVVLVVVVSLLLPFVSHSFHSFPRNSKEEYLFVVGVGQEMKCRVTHTLTRHTKQIVKCLVISLVNFNGDHLKGK